MGQKFKWVICLVVLFLILPGLSQAEEPSIQVQADRNTITVDDNLRLSIIIRGGSALTTPDIPALGNFDVIGKSSGSSIEIINGQMSVTKTFDFELSPRKAGEFAIGPIRAHIDGKTYSAGPVRITVLKSEQPKNYRPPMPSPQIVMPRGYPPRSPYFPSQTPIPSPSSPQGSQGRALTFLTADTDKKEAFLGEQILFTFRLYTAVNIQNAQLTLPDFKDFITEELIKERKYQVDMDGRRYAVNEWRFAIFPTKTGSLQTGPSLVKGSVPVTRRPTRFDDPFFQKYGYGQQYQAKTFSAPSVPLQVKALPPAPGNFSGLVGQFTLQSHLSQDRLNTGDTADLKIEISGSGNINEAKLPSFPSTPYFKIYPGKPVLKLDKTLQGLQGKKTFTFAMVAERPGTTSIPNLVAYYFNPRTVSYEPLNTGESKVVIQGTAVDEKMVTAGLEKPAELFASPKKILGMKEVKAPVAVLYTQGLPGWEKTLWYALLFGSPIFYSFLFIWDRRRAMVVASADDRKRSRAFKNAKIVLGKLNSDRPEGNISELTQIIKNYLSDRFLIKGTALTPSEIEKLLITKNIPAETVRRMVYLLEQLDSWKYGGLKESMPDIKVLKIEITDLFREIEKSK